VKSQLSHGLSAGTNNKVIHGRQFAIKFFLILLSEKKHFYYPSLLQEHDARKDGNLTLRLNFERISFKQLRFSVFSRMTASQSMQKWRLFQRLIKRWIVHIMMTIVSWKNTC